MPAEAARRDDGVLVAATGRRCGDDDGIIARLYGHHERRVRYRGFDQPGAGLIDRQSEVGHGIEVEILENSDWMGGAGEPGTPPSIPALANAVFALTGKRIRDLPMNREVTFA